MRRLHQTRKDNCFSTCIGGLLDLSDEQIARLPDHTKEGWHVPYQSHLKGFGYQFLSVHVAKEEHVLNCLGIATGPSPYTPNQEHSVIVKGTEILWDPKSEGLGLLGLPLEWEYCYLIPILKEN